MESAEVKTASGDGVSEAVRYNVLQLTADQEYVLFLHSKADPAGYPARHGTPSGHTQENPASRSWTWKGVSPLSRLIGTKPWAVPVCVVLRVMTRGGVRSRSAMFVILGC